jgi:ubiquinone biosynthesis UbiH/UbiF/VisC/COQ6 family hydroxylase
MKTDVLIVGAGLVGASLATALQGCGVDVVLLDAASPKSPYVGEWDTRIYAISPGSKNFLQAGGAWSRIPVDRIAHVEGMEVHGDDATAMIRFSAYQAGLRELCSIVESRAIQHALIDVIEAAGEVTCLFGSRPMALAVDDRCAQVDLEDGRSIEARLVVGADGAHSWVREAVGIEARIRPYHQQGVVANFETERSHGNIARQWFRNDGVLALLPLPGNRVSMVWSTWDAAAERLVCLEADALAREVEAASAHELGELRVLAPARGFPLRWMRAHEAVRPRVALVGDAAHSVHPLAGQGVNLGFQDADMLVDVLRRRGAQDDCGDYRLLRRYARSRSEPVAMMQSATDALQRLFNNDVPGLKWLRNAGLNLTNGVVPVKSLFVAHALG